MDFGEKVKIKNEDACYMHEDLTKFPKLARDSQGPASPNPNDCEHFSKRIHRYEIVHFI